MTEPKKDDYPYDLIAELEYTQEPLAHKAADALHAMYIQQIRLQERLVLAELSCNRRQQPAPIGKGN